MPLFSDHIAHMYYGGSSSYSAPYSYSSSVSPIGSSYSASYLNPGGAYSSHSSLSGYSRAPLSSRWTTTSGRNYSPILSTISERGTSSPVRLNSPRRLHISKRSYIAPSYTPRPININTADIDVSRDRYRKRSSSPTPPKASPPREAPSSENEAGPFMPRVDGKPETGIDSSPGKQRSTIKRGRTVVRLHTIKRRERDSPRKSEKELQNNEETQKTDDPDTINETTDSKRWRDKLSEDLVYIEKREKKTIGAKMVEKFILRDEAGDEIRVKEILPREETSHSLSATPSPPANTDRSPDRRCSMEILAEQSNLFDSLIRKENLSTATLDLSKVGIKDENKEEINCSVEEGNKRRSLKRENSLKSTKSDYSLHERLNSLKDNKDSKHLTKKRSVRKSLSSSSIGRLDSITEFPKEISQTINLSSINENQQSIKLESKKIKAKPKLKAKITSSVEVSPPKSPLKFIVENVTVEVKACSPKKEITYNSSIDAIVPIQNSEFGYKDRVSKLRSNKRKSKIGQEDATSSEIEEGNFWDKIGKRETVYLTQRKQNIEAMREKTRRAFFLFSEEDESGTNDESSAKCEDVNQQPQTDVDKPSNFNTDAMVKPLGNLNFEQSPISGSYFQDCESNFSSVKTEIKPIQEEKTKSLKKYESKNTVTIEQVLEPVSRLDKEKMDKPQKPQSESDKCIHCNALISTEQKVESPIPTVPTSKNIKSLISDNSGGVATSGDAIKVSLVKDTKDIESTDKKINTNVTGKKEETVTNQPPTNIERTETPKLEFHYMPRMSKYIKEEIKSSNSMPIIKDSNILPDKNTGSNVMNKQKSEKERKVIPKSGEKYSVPSKPKTPPQSKISKEVNEVSDNISTVTTNKPESLLPEPEKINLKVEEVTNATEIKPCVTENINIIPEVKVADDANIPIDENEIKPEISQGSTKIGEVDKAETIPLQTLAAPVQEDLKSEKNIINVQSPKRIIKEEAAVRPLIATPRPLQKKSPQIIQSSSSSETSSEDSSEDEDADEESDASGGSAEFFECETNPDGRTSTGSNDSGFDSSAPASPANFLHVKKGGESSGPSGAAPEQPTSDILEQELEQSTAYGLFKKTGRFTPPARSIPRFRKYNVEDFQFIKVLGKGSFGKVLLAELRDTEYYYAVKCLKKDVVLEDDDVECTLIERKVLALGTNHPYLCHLFATFQTDSHLFFVMEYLNGGDLMFHIQQSGRFPEARARFYGAEIVSGLKFLHKRGIIYRDLKLDNILLDYEGHIRIADFGMCKLQIYLDKTADTFCGTPDYMAPEIIKGLKYNQTVDWWSFGVLLYEMLIGQSPFSGCDEDELFWSICNEMPSYPRFLSQESLTILTRLLDKDARTRLGSGECMHGDVRDQDFFRAIHWDRLERRELETPFKPKVKHPMDTQYFDRAFTGERPRLTVVEATVLRSMDQAPFRGFSYTNPNATDR